MVLNWLVDVAGLDELRKDAIAHLWICTHKEIPLPPPIANLVDDFMTLCEFLRHVRALGTISS